MNFEFKKPPNWSKLPLYEKIKIYGSQLTRLHSSYVDKLDVKKLVKKLCPQIKVARVIRQLNGPNDINKEDLQSGQLLKASHGSGWILDLLKESDIERVKGIIMSWNKIYSQTEIQYKYLRPRFFIEEKIHCKYSGKTGKAYDLKMHCIKGQPYFFLLRKDQRLRNYYDLEWNPIMPLEFEFQKPDNFSTIVEFCRQLSKPFEYVRVDLYIGVDGIYFSEYTFTPHGGKQRLSTDVEINYGVLWT